MVAHDAPGMKLETFLLLAMPKAINENITVDFTGEDIYPLHYGKADKVDGLRVSDFVSADAHGGFGCPLNLQPSIGKSNTPQLPVMTACSIEWLINK
jgi:hypothetical protein